MHNGYSFINISAKDTELRWIGNYSAIFTWLEMSFHHGVN